jgi:Arf-GAP with coiled-coil, ANK repeat and PH domain-containing protein
MNDSNGAILFIEKPKPSDAFSIKERYIQTKVTSSINFIFDQSTDGFFTINI